MNEETLEILQMHALQLLGIRLESYESNNIKGIGNCIRTPFTRTTSKQYKDELKHFLKYMNSNKIYHYKNQFGVNFLMFKFKKYKQIYIIGPFIEKRPNERRCYEIMKELNIDYGQFSILKQYLLKIPLCHKLKAQKMCRLAIQFLKKRNNIYDIVKIDFHFHVKKENIASNQVQMNYTLEDIEYRYKLENQLLTAVEYGNVDEAIATFHKMSVSLVGLSRVKDDLSNERYKAYLINTLCRKAIEKVGVGLLQIDEISTSFASRIDQAKDIVTLDELMASTIIAYSKLAMKAKFNDFSPKLSKAIQYIERNLNSVLTLNKLAEHVELAPSYLSRIFNQELHKSISQYITELRIEKGRDLLVRTNMTIAEVACYVGFREQSYFSQCFKKQYGKSPLKFRTEHKVFY